MITEDFVSFETAKLLKEKGFIGECERRYSLVDTRDWQGDIRVELSTGESYSSQIIYIKESIQCPTLQMAMKWLRNNFHLEIYSFHDAIQESNDWWYRIEHHSKGCSLTEDESDVIYKTYEEACEAAIKYCLENLI